MMLSYQFTSTGCCSIFISGKTRMLQVFAFILLSINVDSQSLQTLSSSHATIQPSFNIVTNSTRIASSFLPGSTPLLYSATRSSTQDIQTTVFNRNSLASSVFSSNETNILQRSASSTHNIAQKSLQQTSILSSQLLSNNKTVILQQSASSTHNITQTSLQQTSILSSRLLSNNKTDILQQSASSTHNIAQTSLQQTSILSSQSLSNNKTDILSTIQTTVSQNRVNSLVGTNVSTIVQQNRTKLTTTLDFRTTPSSNVPSVSQTGVESHSVTPSSTKIIGEQSSVQPMSSSLANFTFTSLSSIMPSSSLTSNEVNRTAFAESLSSRPQLASSVMSTNNTLSTTSVNIDIPLSSVTQSVTAPLRTTITESSKIIVRNSSISSSLQPKILSSSLLQIDPSIRTPTAVNASVTSSLQPKIPSSSLLQIDPSIRTPTVGNASAKLASTIAAVSFSTSIAHATVQLHATPANSSTIGPQPSIAADRSSSILSSTLVAPSVGQVDATNTVNLQPTISKLETSQSLLQSTFAESKTTVTAPQSSRSPLEPLISIHISSIDTAINTASQLVKHTPNGNLSSQEIPPTTDQIFVPTSNLKSQILPTKSSVSVYSTQVSNSSVTQVRSIKPSYTNSYRVTSSVKAVNSELASPSLVTFSMLQTSNSLGVQPGLLTTYISTNADSASSTIKSSSIPVVDSSSQHSAQDSSQRTTTTPSYQTIFVTSHLFVQSSYSPFIPDTKVRTSVVASLSLGIQATPSVPILISKVSSTLSNSPMQKSQSLHSELATQPLGSAMASTSTPVQSLIPTNMLSESIATVQRTVDAKSSQLPLAASTNEQRIFSSVYPCWIVNTVYMTIDASAIYPNQTLHTETAIQATKSFDYMTQSSIFPAASSQEALFTGIATQSIVVVASRSSSMHGIMSTLDAVHGSATSSLSGLSKPTTSYEATVTPTQSILAESMVSSSRQQIDTTVSIVLHPSSSATEMTTKSSFSTASPIGTNRVQTSVELPMTTKTSVESTVFQRMNQSVDSTQSKQSTGSSSGVVIGSMAIPSLTSIGISSTAKEPLQSTLDQQTGPSFSGHSSLIATSLQPPKFSEGTLASTVAASTADSLSGPLTSQIKVDQTLQATLETPQSTVNVTGEVYSSTSQTDLTLSQFISQTENVSVPIIAKSAMSFHELSSSFVSSPLSASPTSEISKLSGVIQASKVTQTLSTILDINALTTSAENSVLTSETATFVQRQQLSTDISQPTSVVKSEISERSTLVTASLVFNASITNASVLPSKIAALSDRKVQSLTTGGTMHTSSSAEVQQQLGSTVSSKHTAFDTTFHVSIVPTLRHSTSVESSQSIMPNLTATVTHHMLNTTSSNGMTSDQSVTMTPSFKPSVGNSTHSIGSLAVPTNIETSSNTVQIVRDTSSTIAQSDKSVTMTPSFKPSAGIATHNIGLSAASTNIETSSSTVQVLQDTSLTSSQSDKSVTMTPSFKPSAGSATQSIGLSAASTNIETSSSTVQVLRDTSLTSSQSDKSVTMTLNSSTERIVPSSSILVISRNVTETPQISTSVPVAQSANLISAASNVIATSSLPINSNSATSKQPQSSSISIASSAAQAPDPIVISTPRPLRNRKRRALNDANGTSIISSNVSTPASWNSPILSSNSTISVQQTRSFAPTISQQLHPTVPTASSVTMPTASLYSSNSTGKLSSVIADTVRLLQPSGSTTSLQPVENITTTTSQFVDPTATQLSVSQTGVMRPTLTVVDMPNSTAVLPSSQIVSNKSIGEVISATVQENTSIASMSVQASVPSSQASNFTIVSSVQTPSLSQVPLMETNLQTSSGLTDQASSVTKPEGNSSLLSSKYTIHKSLESSISVTATTKSTSQFVDPTATQLPVSQTGVMRPTLTVVNMPNSTVASPSSQIVSNKSIGEALSATLQVNTSVVSMGVKASVHSSQASNFTIVSSVQTPSLSQVPLMETNLQTSSRLTNQASSVTKPEGNSSLLSRKYIIHKSLESSTSVTATTKSESNSSSLPTVESSKYVIDSSLKSDSSSIASSSNIITSSRMLLSSEVVSVSLSGSIVAFSLQATLVTSGISGSASAATLASSLSVFTSSHSQDLSSAKRSGSETPFSKGIASSIASQVQVLVTSTIQAPRQSSLVTATVTTAANESSQRMVEATQRTVGSTPALLSPVTSPIEMQYSTSAALPASIQVTSSLKPVEKSSRPMLSASAVMSQNLEGSLTLIEVQATSDTLKVGSLSNLLTTPSPSESIFTEMKSPSTVSIMPSVLGVDSSSPHMSSKAAMASMLTSSVVMVSPNMSLSVPTFTTSKFDAFESQNSTSATSHKSTNSSTGMTTPVFSTVEAGLKHTTVSFASSSSSISLKATDSVHETSASVATGTIMSPLLSPSFMLESPSKTSSLVLQSFTGNSPSTMTSSAVSSSSKYPMTQNALTTSHQSVNPIKSTTVVTYVTSSLGQCIAYYTPRLATPNLSTLTRPSVASQLTSRPVQETLVNTASTLLKSTLPVVISSTPSYHPFVSSDFPASVQTQNLIASSTVIAQPSPSMLTSGISPSVEPTVSYSMSRSLAKSDITDLTSAASQNMTTSLLLAETQTISLQLTATSAVSQAVSSASESVGVSQSSAIPSLTRDVSPSLSVSEMSKGVSRDSIYSSTNIPLPMSTIATAILPTASYTQQFVSATITASQSLLQSSKIQVATPAISSGESMISTSQYSPASDTPIHETISLSQSASRITPSLFKPETTVHSTEATPSYSLTLDTSQQASTSIYVATSTGLRVSTSVQSYTSTVLPLKTSLGVLSQTSLKASSQTSSILELPASSSVLQPVVPTAASTIYVIALSTSLEASSLASSTVASSVSPSSISSQLPTSTPVATTTQPVSIGLCDLVLIVAPAIDITSATFKLDLETKLVETFNKVKALRKRRAVTQAGTTVNVTSVTRQGSTSTVNVDFYVKENNAVVPAQKTASVLNQLTVTALSQRLNQTVASPVVVVTASTTAKPTTAAVTVAPPSNYQILGMVLTDEASNNISSGSNRALFETRMAQYYRNGKGISGTVNFTISYLVHEVKNIVYLEFYVTVANVRQNSTVIAMFYHASNVTVTINTLSALLKMTVITEPYSISSISASDLFQVKMTIKPSTPTNMNTAQFKDGLAQRITKLYREAKDTKVKRKRRALGSISTTIISLVTNTNGQASIVFYILDQGLVQNGASVASILNRVATNRMSAILGVEVITVPAAVAVLPVPAPTSTNNMWIIGVVIGACVLMIIVFACIYWRWQIGGPRQGKLDIEEISMNEKKQDVGKGAPYGGYRDVAKFAEGRSKGGPAMKTTTFTSPPDTDEKPDLSRSMRRKVKQNNGVASRPAGRQNTAYEESEEEDEEEDDDDYESEVPALPQKQQISRPLSAQRRVEVQPGPSRDPKRTSAAVQRSSAAAKRREEVESDYDDDDDDDDDDDSEEDGHSQRVPSAKPAKYQRPAAAELPPISQMKDVQEAPSYPPVRFRTNIEPETSIVEHLPPLMKTGTSLIGRRLPNIDPDLKQKSDLERSRNKQRQRLRASGRRPDLEKRKEVESTKTEKREWRKAQLDIDSLLDPVAATSKRSPRASNKRARRRHRFRRSHKVDITSGEPQRELKESKNVQLNNYMSLSSPRHSVSVDESDDTRTEEDRDTNIDEARERIHNLLDDAFTILDPHKRKPSPRSAPAPVTEERLLEGKEEALSQAPIQHALPPRYQVPALPPPPHGRATAPPPGERKRMFNYSMPITQMQQTGLTSMNGTQPLTPVVTRDPMVVMDRAEKNRYLSQRLGQSAYGRPPAPFAYTYERSPSDQPVYITPVQQQPDGLGGVIWSPYAAEVIREDINSSSAPLFNTMESPAHEQFNMKSTPIMSTPQSQRMRQPHHTSINMTTSPYAGLGETPQPLIRAIKDELLRLSQSARGRTQIQELSTDEMRRDPIS